MNILRAMYSKIEMHMELSASALFDPSDPTLTDLDQLELPVLCDGLRRYLQDLPQPIVPSAIYTQLVHTVQGENTQL